MKTYTVQTIGSYGLHVGVQQNAHGYIGAELLYGPNAKPGDQLQGEENEDGVTLIVNGRRYPCPWRMYSTQINAGDIARNHI